MAEVVIEDVRDEGGGEWEGGLVFVGAEEGLFDGKHFYDEGIKSCWYAEVLFEFWVVDAVLEGVEFDHVDVLLDVLHVALFGHEVVHGLVLDDL